MDYTDTMLKIMKEKNIADRVLHQIMIIDPEAIVSGGAPRDWYMGKSCSDIDVYFKSAADDSRLREQIARALDTPIELVIVKGNYYSKRHLDSPYGPKRYSGNANIRAVFDILVDDKKVQLIVITNETHSINEQLMGCSLSQIEYTPSLGIMASCPFLISVGTKALIFDLDICNNDIVWMDKIRRKFPDFFETSLEQATKRFVITHAK